MKPFLLSLMMASAACSLSALSVNAQTPARPKVVVISLDAFAAKSLQEPALPAPTLRALEQSGAYATAMQPINPTVTWPNHTAMVTGVNAAQHHVLVNGLIEHQRTDQPLLSNAQAPKSKLVAAPTIYDVAHAAGLTTAEVDWVAILRSGTIDWSFAEDPDANGEIARAMVADGTITREQLAHFGAPSQAWRDRMYTAAATEIVRRHHPDLLLVHLLALDSIEHETGYGNSAGRNTIAFLDDRVREIIDAVRAAGDLDRTTFLIVSDHGQSSYTHEVDASVLLRKAGLQQSTTVMPDGGFALVYQQKATPESRAALKKIFSNQPGIRAALTPEEAAKDGWPTPAESDQAPDLLLYAEKDYVFHEGNNPTGELVKNIAPRGAHGYPNTEPLMQAIFIASGAAIKPVGKIDAIPNLDIAPTIARILHLDLPHVQGQALTQILQ